MPVEGQEEPAEPTPDVALIAAAGDEHGGSATEDVGSRPRETTAAAPVARRTTTTVAYPALAVGAAGLIAGLGALGLVWRRGRAA